MEQRITGIGQVTPYSLLRHGLPADHRVRDGAPVADIESQSESASLATSCYLADEEDTPGHPSSIVAEPADGTMNDPPPRDRLLSKEKPTPAPVDNHVTELQFSLNKPAVAPPNPPQRLPPAHADSGMRFTQHMGPDSDTLTSVLGPPPRYTVA